MKFRGDGWRAAVIVVLLLGSLLMAAGLAWLGERSMRLHRRAAENVVRDYAALAAEEFVRRAAARVGYEGFYPVIGALTRGIETDGDLSRAIPDPRALSEDEARLRDALPLVRTYFLLRPGADALSLRGAGEGEEELRAWLESEARTERSQAGPFVVVQASVGGRPATAVIHEWTTSRGRWASGFEVDLEALASFLAPAVSKDPLLPPSLGNGTVTNDALALSFLDHGGNLRFRWGSKTFPDFEVERPFGDAYGGALAGSKVRLSVDPEAAPLLLIGGLPPSRLPLVGALLLGAAVLVLAAIQEVRRERRLQSLRAEFVANVSHELRTPLAQIRMFAETLLLGRVRSEEERIRSLRIIDREVRRLSHLVENVLQFSRRGGSETDSPFAPCRLAPRVSETIELFYPLVSDTGTRILTRLDPDVEARVDADGLRQVLLNLLDNAAKFGPSPQEILVGVESGNGTSRLFVEDQGPGVPEAESERIFERFYRLARNDKAQSTGTGIGLSVVRELVSRHGGRAFVERGAGGGARFVVEFPGCGEP